MSLRLATAWRWSADAAPSMQEPGGTASHAQCKPESHCQVCFLQGIFNLSHSQIQDLMFLRRVFLLKEHELHLQQAALMAKLQQKCPALLCNVTRVANLANQLRLHAGQCHLLVQRLCWAMYLGVS